MSFRKKIGIYLIYPLFFTALGFCGHMTLEDYFYPLRGQGAAGTKYEKEQDEARQEKAPELSLQAVELEEQVINADTRFVVKTFDLTDSSRSQTEEELPEQYIGMDREEFLDIMNLYALAPSLEDRQKGFLSLDVERFSSGEVVIRKNYESSEKCTEFYLAVENNYVVVYEPDKKTRYMSTGIPLQSLSDELAREIVEFKYIGSEAELYNFLESYSS